MSRLIAAVARAFRPAAETRQRFHLGPHGPYVCDHDDCASPHLTLAEIVDNA